jgi:6-pyruvoyltetrahydropterin/6-carboxytetrahydropterin synthase
LTVRRRFRFEAAHRLPGHAGECRELHGHSYGLSVGVEREVDPESGMAIDFSDLKRIVQREIVDRLDHTCLNDTMANPTAEMIVVWIWERLAGLLPGLAEVELHETGKCSVVYRG